MNYKNLILSLFFLMFIGIAFPQKDEDNPNLARDSRVDRLIEKHRQFNQANPGVDGFRVQIFFD